MMKPLTLQDRCNAGLARNNRELSKKISQRLKTFAATALTALTLLTGITPAQAEGGITQPPPCPGAGSPCAAAAGAPAVTGNNAQASTGSGNPINFINGNKFQTETDMAALPGVLGLELVRYYNSLSSGIDSPIGIVGRGWRVSYETRLSIMSLGDSASLTIDQADGTVIKFRPAVEQKNDNSKNNNNTKSIPTPDLWQSTDGHLGSIRFVSRTGKTPATATSSDEYIWTWGAGAGANSGRQLTFNRDGQLLRIAAPTGEFVSLDYTTQGWLNSVTDPQGRRININYMSQTLQAQSKQAGVAVFKGVQSIETPVGLMVYRYGTMPVTAPVAGSATDSASNSVTNKRALLANLASVELMSSVKLTKAQAEQTKQTQAQPQTQGIQRHYHFEDARNPTLLTGITVKGTGSDGVAMNQRIVTWGYDAYGRANLSVKGEPARLATDAQGKVITPKRLAAGTGIEQVTLEWYGPEKGQNKDGATVIQTNSLGQQTRYRLARINNELKLMQSRGAGCASCAPVNIRYGYDKQGRLIEQTPLDDKGQPQTTSTTQTKLDALGRVEQISVGATRIARYEYEGDSTAPSLIARPSVVAGKEFQVRMSYNSLGQVLKITESGYSPLGKSDGPDNSGSAIERSTVYQYQTINSRSVLSQIDGPLANGPKGDSSDSDITRYEWDTRASFITAVTAPGGLKTTIQTDTITGLPKQTTFSDGYRQIQTVMQYGASSVAAMQPELIIQRAYRLQNGEPLAASQIEQTILNAKHDAMGRRTQVVNGQAAQANAPATPASAQNQSGSISTKTLAYSEANKPTTLRLPDGSTQDWTYDSEGRMLAQVTRDAQGQITSGDMWLRDAKGRPLAHFTPQGLQQMFVHMDGFESKGLANGLQQTAADKPTTVKAQSTGKTQSTSDSQSRRKLIDDFGRVVLEQLPEDGMLITRHEANDKQGGQVQTQTQRGKDGKGQISESLWFDTAGRLVQRQRTGSDHATNANMNVSSTATSTSSSKASCIETFHYEGKLLKSLIGCGSEQRFERDAYGLITQRWQTNEIDQTINTAKTSKATFSEQYRYDAQGILVGRVLVDGQALRYGFDAKTGIAKDVQLQSRWLSWLENTLGSNVANRIASIVPASMVSSTAVLADMSELSKRSEVAVAADAGVGARPVNQPSGVTQSASSIASTSTAQVIKASASSAVLTAGVNNPSQTKLQTQPSFDNYGRQTLHIASSGVNKGKSQRLVWDDAHRLVQVIDSASNTLIAQYTYDSLGNRIAKTTFGKASNESTGVPSTSIATTTRYIYDTAHRVIGEADQTGGITRQYLYGDHKIHSVLEQGKRYAVQTDWRGLPNQVSDAQGKTVWQQRWDEWGRSVSVEASAQRATDKPFTMPLRLAGQYFDDETGLHYNIHRYLDPKESGTAGRYISADPLGTPDGNDRYAYLNANPNLGIDPLGLFEIPYYAFIGSASIYGPKSVLAARDGGHGDILRIAFSQHNRANGTRFSQTIIDQIIRNNYQTDANTAGCVTGLGGIAGGGQCNAKNHFDNPNDGALYEVTTNPDGSEKLGNRYASYSDGKDDTWISDALDQLNGNRAKYGTAQGRDISAILGAFGQNSHALADFYAHSNWVDSNGFTEKTENGKTVREYNRGGFFTEKFFYSSKEKCGWVPIGLNKSSVWDEALVNLDSANLFTGTINLTPTYMCTGARGDITCTADKSTHGYWNKDDKNSLGGKQEYSVKESEAFSNQQMYYWAVEEYNKNKLPANDALLNQKTFTYGTDWYADGGIAQSNLKNNDRIYVKKPITNRHQMAWYLAVEHTKKEIERLYNQASNVNIGSAAIPSNGALSLGQVFQMDAAALTAKNVSINNLKSKV